MIPEVNVVKRILVLAAFLVTVIFCVSVNADEMKIAMDGEVKLAKEIGTGKGITFTLPDLENDEYFIYAIELAVFEKQYGESEWHIYKDDNNIESKKQYIESPSSLTFNADFGDPSDYRDKARYKIAYRYYVQNLSDTSITAIAGADEKDGWRLVGEDDATAASSDGFVFYKNSAPTMSIECFTYKVHSTGGLEPRYVSNVSEVCFPSDVFENGVTVQMSATDFDLEDILTVSYRLEDAVTGEVIQDTALPNDSKIVTDHITDSYRLYIIASDNFGGSVTSDAYVFNVDSTPAYVVSEFNDGGYVMMGRNLFSDFTVNDGTDELMTGGTAYAEIYTDGILKKCVFLEYIGEGIYRLDTTVAADGAYTVILKLYDKAGNESTHTFYQTLDSTAPSLYFETPMENSDATVYGAWMNESKKIIVDATDIIAGVRRYQLYQNGTLVKAATISTQNEITLSHDVTNTITGKINYAVRVYDNAKAINKTTNMYKSANGNSIYVTKSVWLDKTNPTITHDISDAWHDCPYTVNVWYNDYPSSASVNDASGVILKQYAITDSLEEPDSWLSYTGPLEITEGGVFYLHIKATDNAGNVQTETVRIRTNTKSRITSDVVPTDSYKHTIYYSESKLYVVKNTAYNTKFHFGLYDADVDDAIRADVLLVNKDDNDCCASASATVPPGETAERDVVFNMQYIDSDKNKLPDGVYDMYLTVTEIKGGGEEIQTHENIAACEVVIKRSTPPTPVIQVSGGYVTIDYPKEPLSGSLNTASIRSHYKYQYKTVKTGDVQSNTYIDYTDKIPAEDMTVTALYTDIAGNSSIATLRIFSESDDGIGVDITSEGNNTTVEESRSANVYYIGTRREKQKGINAEIFNFMN